jgi:hypothetical protein
MFCTSIFNAGYIDIDEMVDVFKQMGVSIDRHEAQQFIRRWECLVLLQSVKLSGISTTQQ